MNRKEIEERIQHLKMDYIRIQGDLDKLEAVGGNASGAIRELEIIEDEIKELNQALHSSS
ncbi:SE1832 family protein [Salibacterium aidingense]|uniref:SE1832 family protein n=1 Tax=Salibacterium aidingense TaxID=384933 RepID=UPI0004038AF3|nr:SE1832 family protein [Salibacterium aidingense]